MLCTLTLHLLLANHIFFFILCDRRPTNIPQKGFVFFLISRFVIISYLKGILPPIGQKIYYHMCTYARTSQ